MYKARPDEKALVNNQHTVFSFLPFDERLDRYVSNLYATKEEYEEQDFWSDADEIVLEHVQERYRELITDVGRDFHGFLHFYFRCVFGILLYLLSFGLFNSFLMNAQLAREHYIQTPSPKKRIYQGWYCLLGWYYGVYYPFECKPVAKVKVEFGKPGKLARLYVTYDECILQAGWIYEFIKKSLCGVYTYKPYGHFPFFHDIYSTKRSDHFDFDATGFYSRSFSDDSEDVLVIPKWGKWRLSVDISSCDASMRSGLFRMSARLFDVVGAGYLIPSVFTPFTSRIAVINPSNPEERFKMIPRDVFMGSGSPDTTHMNNLYNYGVKAAVYMEICRTFALNGVPHNGIVVTEDTIEQVILDCYVRGARCMGAVTTQTICPKLENSDFLKEVSYNTPNGVVVGLALGPILRGLGGVEGDIEPQQLGVSTSVFRQLDDAERMERFVGGVIKGLCNEPRNIILDALRGRFTKGQKIEGKHFTSNDRSHLNIPVWSLMERYGGSEADWYNLAGELERISLGDHLASPLLAEIYWVDYGLPRAPPGP
jgi:hypothetical protein